MLIFSVLWKFSFLGYIKSNDYCDSASVKLKYINSYDYNFDFVLFVVSLEDSHFECRESMLVSHQNLQIPKEIDISIYLGSCILYWHIVKQSSILCLSFFWNLYPSLRRFPLCSYDTHVQLAQYIKNEL